LPSSRPEISLTSRQAWMRRGEMGEAVLGVTTALEA
jgi:hypothetical protein